METTTETAPAAAPIESPAPTASPDTNGAPADYQQTNIDINRLFDEPGDDVTTTSVQRVQANTPLAAKQATQPQVARRQYRTDEERRIFSNMSNEAYDALYPEWSKLKSGEYVSKAEVEKARAEAQAQAAQAKTERWYDHPKGYLLSDAYTELTQNNQLYTDIVDHYQQALANVAAGRPFNRIVPDEKRKYLIDSQNQIPPSPQAHAFITTELSRFLNLQQQAEGKIKDMESGFSKRFDPIKTALTNAEATTFEKFEKVPGFERAWKGELAMFPTELQGLPEYRALAKASVVIKAILMRQTNNGKANVANSTQPDTTAGTGAVAGSTDMKDAISRLNDIVSTR